MVTVLPQGHGEEILQRGQAMEQRVAAGAALPRPAEREDERWDAFRRRWRKDVPQPVVVERIVRGPNTPAAPVHRIDGAAPEVDDDEHGAEPSSDAEGIAQRVAKIVSLPERRKPEGPVAKALQKALETGRRRAAVAALSEALSLEHREASLLPLWNALASEGVPESMTVGDLIEAVRIAYDLR